MSSPLDTEFHEEVDLGVGEDLEDDGDEEEDSGYLPEEGPYALDAFCQQEMTVDGDEDADEGDGDPLLHGAGFAHGLPEHFLTGVGFAGKRKSYYKPTGRPRGRPKGSKANREKPPKEKRPIGRPRKYPEGCTRAKATGWPRGRPPMANRGGLPRPVPDMIEVTPVFQEGPEITREPAADSTPRKRGRPKGVKNGEGRGRRRSLPTGRPRGRPPGSSNKNSHYRPLVEEPEANGRSTLPARLAMAIPSAISVIRTDQPEEEPAPNKRKVPNILARRSSSSSLSAKNSFNAIVPTDGGAVVVMNASLVGKNGSDETKGCVANIDKEQGGSSSMLAAGCDDDEVGVETIVMEDDDDDDFGED